MKNFCIFSKHKYNILDDLNKWEDLEEMQDSFASEEKYIISQGNKYSGYEEDDYGNVHIERLREIGDEMEGLSYERKRRYEKFCDKIFDLKRKINDLIYVERFKIKI